MDSFDLRSRKNTLLLGVALAGLWLALINQLRVEWAVNPQYQYGWGVPLLALYLFGVRWRTRPNPAGTSFSAWETILFVTVSLTFLPIRLIQESNPDWRPIDWLQAIGVVALTLQFLKYSGGLPWVWHFLMPAMFILASVPWPSFIETPLVQFMMNKVAALTVELVNWTGIPAWQRGNIIDLANGPVGVNEACSGVRSLQSTFMAAVFLGGLFLLSWRRRLVLLVGALACSLSLNLVRAYILTIISSESGREGLIRWHDSAGLIILAVSFAFLWWLANYLNTERQPAQSAPTPPAIRAHLVPMGYAAGLLIWLAAVEVGNEQWYARHEKDVPWRGELRVALPETAERFAKRPVSPEVRQILRCDTSVKAVWKGASRSSWQLFLIGWQPGQVSPRMAKVHTPELCLSAAGMRLVSPSGSRKFPTATEPLPMQSYVFESAGTPVYVFFTLWEDHVATGRMAGEGAAPEWRSRLEDVWDGRRQFGQQLLEIAITGVTNAAVAERLFADFVRSSVTIQR